MNNRIQVLGNDVRDDIDAWIEIEKAEKDAKKRETELAELESKLCMRESAIEDEIKRIADYDEVKFIIERTEVQFVLLGRPIANHFQPLAERLKILLGIS